MIVIRHHSLGLSPVAPDPALDDLPTGPLETFDVRDGGAEPVDAADWHRELLAQRRQGEHIKAAIRSGSEVRYYGLTWIPLAMDLGTQLTAFARVEARLRHHQTHEWTWPGALENPPVPPELPDEPVVGRGVVVVRVSASYLITAKQTGAVVSDPLAEVDLRCQRILLDPFGTREELEDFVTAWATLLDDLTRLYPEADHLELFVAGPVGLAFRMGGVVNPRIHRRIRCWQFSGGRYVSSAPIGRSTEELEMKKRILYVAPSPLNAKPLQSDREMRDAFDQRLLTEGAFRERFEVIPHLATLADDFQAHLSRALPDVLHFSGHGTSTGELVFERDRRLGKDVAFEFVARAVELRARTKRIRLALVNACHSSDLAQLLVQNGVDVAVGMSEAINDDVAIAFAKEFYRAVGDGESARTAFDSAVNQLAGFADLHHRQVDVPELFHAEGVDPLHVYLHE